MTHITMIVNSTTAGPYGSRGSGKSTCALGMAPMHGNYIVIDEANNVYDNSKVPIRASLIDVIRRLRGKVVDHIVIVRPTYTEAQAILKDLSRDVIRNVESNTLIEFTHMSDRTFGLT